jgi:hypothetical protein
MRENRRRPVASTSVKGRVPKGRLGQRTRQVDVQIVDRIRSSTPGTVTRVITTRGLRWRAGRLVLGVVPVVDDSADDAVRVEGRGGRRQLLVERRLGQPMRENVKAAERINQCKRPAVHDTPVHITVCVTCRQCFPSPARARVRRGSVEHFQQSLEKNVHHVFMWRVAIL